jgi:polynucleotide 5'-hydroxyl-kinase GRC3/NOL9
VSSCQKSKSKTGDWANAVAKNLLGRKLPGTGICLVLGACDTGKTTLVAALAEQLVDRWPVAIIDADVGQSHIGPPATVGWTLVDRRTMPHPTTVPQFDFSKLAALGLSFVGDVTPTGHLLQLTKAIVRFVEQAGRAGKVIIIDTPGFIAGAAAQVLWWTVQHILQPCLIIAVQQDNELSEILAGMRYGVAEIEVVKPPAGLPVKSPEERKRYRQEQFRKYFGGSIIHSIELDKLAIQANRSFNYDNPVNHLAGLIDVKGLEIAVGLITDWQKNNNIVTLRAPKIDISEVGCLIIGDVSVNIDDE